MLHMTRLMLLLLIPVFTNTKVKLTKEKVRFMRIHQQC
ncbi:hypothetical protein GLYMA_02G259051v4 [Glycine max]|nr:hypothetical protein GLYMA_02G259051v4 [Glycine max]KAH1062116.1 hypothetical protein GYH30_005232 [Glycine max]